MREHRVRVPAARDEGGPGLNQCRTVNCGKHVYATGLCARCYMQAWRGRTPRAPTAPLVPIQGYVPPAVDMIARNYARKKKWTLSELVREALEAYLEG